MNIDSNDVEQILNQVEEEIKGVPRIQRVAGKEVIVEIRKRFRELVSKKLKQGEWKWKRQ